MSDEQTGLLACDVFSIAFKVMGLDFLFTALAKLISAIGAVAASHSGEYAYIYVHPVYDVVAISIPVTKLLIAILILFYGDVMARRLSSGGEVLSTARIGLCTAIKLIGVYIVATGIPRAVEYVVNAYHLGVRTIELDAAVSSIYKGIFHYGTNWPEICRIGLSLIIGVYLIYGARHLLDLAYGRLPFVEESQEVV